MAVRQSRYTADETVQLAEDIYQQKLQSLIETEHLGRYIAIDIETGEYEISNDYPTAAHILRDRQPNAEIGILRIGYPAVGRIGGRIKAVAP